jgi:hypothetical protein
MYSQRTPNFENKYFMFDWAIYKRFVLNRRWKRDYLEIMILVNACSTLSIVELKTRFDSRITYDVNGVSLFHFSHLITLMAYLCSQWTPNVQIMYFMFVWSIYRLFVLNWARKTCLSPNNDNRICLLGMRHSWTKCAFWDMNNKNWRKCCKIV